MKDKMQLNVLVARKWGIQLLSVKNHSLMDWCGTHIPFARETVNNVCKKSFSVIPMYCFNMVFELKLIDNN